VLSPSLDKRAVERAWLLYTPVWGGVCALVMVTGLAERWGDVGLMALGASLGLGAIAVALAARTERERARPLHDTAAAKLAASVVLFSVLYNWLETPFFFDVLHMHFGFAATWAYEHNPLFLYLLTIAYFSTYAVLVMAGYRLARGALPGRLGVAVGFGVAPFAVAFLETLLNANPFTRSLFCYDDPTFALTFGTFAYGLAFVVALPVWIAIDESPDRRLSMSRVVAYTVLAVAADVLLLALLRAFVAPHFTTVIDGANGLGDFGTSCLEPP
jgi:hypothetical protein